MFSYVSIPSAVPTPRILEQVKEERDIEHVSFTGLFRERPLDSTVNGDEAVRDRKSVV